MPEWQSLERHIEERGLSIPESFSKSRVAEILLDAGIIERLLGADGDRPIVLAWRVVDEERFRSMLIEELDRAADAARMLREVP